MPGPIGIRRSAFTLLELLVVPLPLVRRVLDVQCRAVIAQQLVVDEVAEHLGGHVLAAAEDQAAPPRRSR